MSIITISEGIFTGGLELSARLAKRLDYPCIGRQELYEGVKKFGLPDLVIKSISSGDATFMQSPANRIAILNMFRAALLNFAEEGNLVYHGAVGHLLLSSIPNILRVRIIASIDYRINNAMRRHNIDHNQAFSLIKKDDQEGEFSARNLYSVDWQDPSIYDVMLNLNNISLENAVEVIFHMSQLDNFIPSASSQREYGDLQLGCMVWAQLMKDAKTRNADLMVTANNGHVVVHGNTGSEEIVEAIPSVAKSVEGVREVTCVVEVGTKWFG